MSNTDEVSGTIFRSFGLRENIGKGNIKPIRYRERLGDMLNFYYREAAQKHSLHFCTLRPVIAKNSGFTNQLFNY